MLWFCEEYQTFCQSNSSFKYKKLCYQQSYIVINAKKIHSAKKKNISYSQPYANKRTLKFKQILRSVYLTDILNYLISFGYMFIGC